MCNQIIVWELVQPATTQTPQTLCAGNAMKLARNVWAHMLRTVQVVGLIAVSTWSMSIFTCVSVRVQTGSTPTQSMENVKPASSICTVSPVSWSAQMFSARPASTATFYSPTWHVWPAAILPSTPINGITVATLATQIVETVVGHTNQHVWIAKAPTLTSWEIQQVATA